MYAADIVDMIGTNFPATPRKGGRGSAPVSLAASLVGHGGGGGSGSGGGGSSSSSISNGGSGGGGSGIGGSLLNFGIQRHIQNVLRPSM